MERDDNILKIKSYLDSIVADDKKKIEYEAVLTLANHGMNMDIHISEDGIHHEVLWYNRKITSNTSFDEDLEKLVEYIDQLSNQETIADKGERNE